MAIQWEVRLSNRARKNYEQLKLNGRTRPSITSLVNLLVLELEAKGPIRSNWPHYGKLAEDYHHCHLKKGHPTFVACWKVIGKQIEVYYVGTRQPPLPKGRGLKGD